MIRVFPRKNKWTPDDEWAFVGDPPLMMPGAPRTEVHISVAFTWDKNEGLRLYRSWKRFYERVELGGPAFGDPGEEFVPGRYLKEGVVITSRGCPRHCPWCFVPDREGGIRELPIMDGWIVQDNNLLACSRDHVEAVFEMLSWQPHPAEFAGGLDVRLLQRWHIDLLKKVRWRSAFLALDHPSLTADLERAADLLADFARDRKRCYVLVGYGGDTMAQAEERLEKVYNLGLLPFAMLYRGPEHDKVAQDKDWRKFLKKWCRPANYKASMRSKGYVI